MVQKLVEDDVINYIGRHRKVQDMYVGLGQQSTETSGLCSTIQTACGATQTTQMERDSCLWDISRFHRDLVVCMEQIDLRCVVAPCSETMKSWMWGAGQR